jgi:hypothetical protein
MKKRAKWGFAVLGLVAVGLLVAPDISADEGVIIYRAENRGQAAKFRAAERAAAKPQYSYTQQAYQGTTVYFGEGTNLDPNVYSSRVVSFYVTFDNPTVIHAGHRYSDPGADNRDTRIFPRGGLR